MRSLYEKIEGIDSCNKCAGCIRRSHVLERIDEHERELVARIEEMPAFWRIISNRSEFDVLRREDVLALFNPCSGSSEPMRPPGGHDRITSPTARGEHEAVSHGLAITLPSGIHPKDVTVCHVGNCASAPPHKHTSVEESLAPHDKPLTLREAFLALPVHMDRYGEWVPRRSALSLIESLETTHTDQVVASGATTHDERPALQFAKALVHELEDDMRNEKFSDKDRLECTNSAAAIAGQIAIVEAIDALTERLATCLKP